MANYKATIEWRSGKVEVLFFKTFREYFKWLKKFQSQICKARVENLDGLILYK